MTLIIIIIIIDSLDLTFSGSADCLMPRMMK